MILYITRKFPPSIGGMQKVNFHLSHHLSQSVEIKLLAWGGTQALLPLILLKFFFQSIYYLIRYPKIEKIFFGDALLAPLGPCLKVIFRKDIFVMIHGLDVTWRFAPYQFLIPKCLRTFDKCFCISENTKNECIKRGIDPQKIVVIPNGTEPPKDSIQSKSRHLDRLSSAFNFNLQNKKIIITVGRLVERKGVHSFVHNILPLILKQTPEATYLVVGDGPYKNVIENAIRQNHLEESVILTGRVDNSLLDSIYAAADIFAMPNIPVTGDVEGFGIVLLEAGMWGIPIVASSVDGIKETIQHNENGLLVDHNNYLQFSETIITLLKHPDKSEALGNKTKAYVQEKYSWQTITERYKKHLFNTN